MVNSKSRRQNARNAYLNMRGRMKIFGSGCLNYNLESKALMKMSLRKN